MGRPISSASPAHDECLPPLVHLVLAEAQYFQEPVPRPAEIADCAALIRLPIAKRCTRTITPGRNRPRCR